MRDKSSKEKAKRVGWEIWANAKLLPVKIIK